MKKYIITGALLMALAVLLGAFGAHALKDHLTPQMLAIYHTGVDYHFYHSIGLLIIGLTGFHIQSKWLTQAGVFLIAGIVLFSGSLYVLSLTGVKSIGMITPFGGLSFVAGWICLAIGLWKR